MRPCASGKGYDELQTLISVQKSAGEMPHFVVMHLSSKILHSKEVCPLERSLNAVLVFHMKNDPRFGGPES